MENKFLELTSKVDLANFLGITVKQLDFNLYNTKGRYNSFSVPKKNGGKRKILAPIPSLKTIQGKLEKEFNKNYKAKNQVHGFIPNRGIKSNAKIHVNQKHVLNLDLENFFPTINFGRIRGVFLKYPFDFNQEIASLLAQLCTQENQLPQGSPCSPVLSNFVCRRLDNELKKLITSNKCYYSRYADDITISTNLKNFPQNLAKIHQKNVILSDDILTIIKNNGFTVNHSKVSIRRPFEQQYVTGLTVNKKVNVKRTYLRKVRAMLHAWEVYGIENAAKVHFRKYSVRHKGKNNKELFLRIVEGNLLFISDIRGKDDSLFKSLLSKFQKLTGDRTLQNYLSYQGERIQVFTEGNTDWMHLKAALNSLGVINQHYNNLNSMIEIVEYEHNHVVGDSKLKAFLEGYLISKKKEPIIAIFDSDNLQKIGEYAPVTSRRYNKFENSVYTFYLPKPSHRKTSKNCIEHYYKDSDLTLETKDGRRLYLASEFDMVTGNHIEKSGVRCFLGQKKLSAIEGVIDQNVQDLNKNSLALSKKDFAQNILDQTETHKRVNFDSFRIIFDTISSIINDIQRDSI